MTAWLVEHRVRWFGALVVTAVGTPAAVASYRHARTVVERSGDPVMAAWLPLTTDGMLLAALTVMWARRVSGDPVGRGPWCAFALGMVATVATNLAAALPTVEGYVVALWPPVALAVTLELVALLVGRQTRADRTAAPERTAARSAAQARYIGTPDENGELLAELAENAFWTAGPDHDGPVVNHGPTTVPGQSASDAVLVADLRAWANQQPDRPSRNAVMGRYGIGATRAARLLEETSRTGAVDQTQPVTDQTGPGADR